MDIAIGMDVDGPLDKTIERATALRARGFTRMWSSQIFGPDTLTVFAVVGREVPDLDLGTAVVPIQTRHPTMLAAQARTVQDAIGGRLSLGIGLSHKAIGRGHVGDLVRSPGRLHERVPRRPGADVARREVDVHGERVSATTIGTLGPATSNAGPACGGARAARCSRWPAPTDGTLDLDDRRQDASLTHVVPTINAAAAKAGRPTPRVCLQPADLGDRRRRRHAWPR